MVGNFKLFHCKISESLGFLSNKPIIEKVNGFKAQKYDIN